MFEKITIRGMTLNEAIDVLGVQGNDAKAVFDNAKTRTGEKIKAQRKLVKGKRTGKLTKLKS